MSRKGRKAAPAIAALKMKSLGPLRGPFATQGRSYRDGVSISGNQWCLRGTGFNSSSGGISHLILRPSSSSIAGNW